MQRMYSLFSKTRQVTDTENTPLIYDLQKVVVSNLQAIDRNKTCPFLSDEIKACIAILRDAIKDTEAYREQKRKCEEYYRIRNLLVIAAAVVSSGVSLKMMIYYHHQLINFIHQAYSQAQVELFEVREDRNRLQPISWETKFP